MTKSKLAGILFILIGASFFVSSFSYSAGAITEPGPALFPGVVSFIVMVLGFLMVIKK